jgi:hypothetical protein
VSVGAASTNNDALLKRWLPTLEAFEAGLWVFFPLNEECIWIEKPIIRREGQILHSDSQPALELPGERLFFWHGVMVPPYVIEKPAAITVRDIETEENAEVRRVKMERFGLARFLRESGAQLIHSDDWGMLYRKKVPGDEPLVMVKVVNSTPEPDGSFKDYFLRVPPNMERARQAVAWTFGKEELAYDPVLQT